jgi:cytoskeleton protein RodZ
VAERIHVAIRYLDAIENGDPAGVPAAVYIRGFVINYVRVLGLDEETVLRILDEGNAAPFNPPQPVSPTSRAAAREKAKVSLVPDWRRNLVIIGTVVVVGILAGLSIRGVMRLFSVHSGEGVPPSPFDANNPAASSKAAEPRTAASPAKQSSLRQVTVSVTAIQECWMQVQVDDAKTADIELKPGEARWFAGASRVRLFIGNAGGVAISGPQGPIAMPTKPGKVVHLLVTRDDVERLKMPIAPPQTSTVSR